MYAYQEATGGDRSVSRLHVLARPLAAILDAAFQLVRVNEALPCDLCVQER